MSYLEDLQRYLASAVETDPELVPGRNFFCSPPLPHQRKRGGPGVPAISTFISQATGAGENVKRFKNQAASSTPIVQIVHRNTEYIEGHETAIAIWRSLGPKIPVDDAPTGYNGHVLQQSAPDFQGVDPDGMMLWAIRFTLYIDYEQPDP